MLKYLKYFSYVFRHKWFVFVEACKLGIPWLGIIHDMSKFLPDEFVAYTNFFYGKNPIKRDKTGYYKPTTTGDDKFDFAWLLHQKRNKHHWQWWILPEDQGSYKILDMPDKYILEMVADWKGAGLAQGKPDTNAWYEANKHKIVLSERTRFMVERILKW